MTSRTGRIVWSSFELTRVRETGPQVLGSQDIGKVAQDDIGSKDREHFIRYDLNSKNKIIGKEVVSIGTANMSLVHPREVFKGALLNNAIGIIIAHNHPSGDTTPSKEDRVVNEVIERAAKLLGIEYLDFLIVSMDEVYSFKDSE